MYTCVFTTGADAANTDGLAEAPSDISRTAAVDLAAYPFCARSARGREPAPPVTPVSALGYLKPPVFDASHVRQGRRSLALSRNRRCFPSIIQFCARYTLQRNVYRLFACPGTVWQRSCTYEGLSGLETGER